MSDCVHNSVSALSEYKFGINEHGRYDKVFFTNKICHSCGCHWYGEKLLTKKEWDEWINSAFNEA